MFETTLLAPADPVDRPAPPVPLGERAPSGWTALELEQLTAAPALLGDAELVEALVGWERVVSWAQACQVRLLAEFARRRPPDTSPEGRVHRDGVAVGDWAADEVAVALRVHRVTAADRLTLARTLTRVLPETLAAWRSGALTERKVRILTDAVAGLDDAAARAVQDRVLGRAERQTPGLLRRSVRRAVLAVDPDGAERRARRARADRRVVHTPEADGMSCLEAWLPATDATAVWARLTALARGLGADDPRGMDARRADLLADLLTGRGCVAVGPCPCRPTAGESMSAAPPTDPGADPRGATIGATGGATNGATGGAGSGTAAAAGGSGRCSCAGGGGGGGGGGRCGGSGGRALVQVTVAATTLLGLDQAPGELAGYGPIPAALAREIAADATWRRLLTDPATGTVTDVARRTDPAGATARSTTYTPSAALADLVRARDRTCRFPGCTAPAANADLDHTVPFDHHDPDRGGPTEPGNLAALCRHHHRLKTFAPGWHVHQHPDGTLTWTTPTGHTSTTRPPDHRPEPAHPATPSPAAPPPTPTPPPATTPPARAAPTTTHHPSDGARARAALPRAPRPAAADDPLPF